MSSYNTVPFRRTMERKTDTEATSGHTRSTEHYTSRVDLVEGFVRRRLSTNPARFHEQKLNKKS